MKKYKVLIKGHKWTIEANDYWDCLKKAKVIKDRFY
jgi:hypothetical protein